MYNETARDTTLAEPVAQDAAGGNKPASPGNKPPEMTAPEFLGRVLPSKGLYCYGVKPPNGKFFNKHVKTKEELAASVVRADATGADVYHACASFKKPGSREHTNVAWLRSFWADIDTQETHPNDAGAYVHRKAAASAIGAFRKAVDLAKTLVIDSGGGLHPYWVLDADLTREEWEPTAALLKAAMDHQGLKADASRAKDASSVLRSPETHNRKGGRANPVQVLHPGGVMSHAHFRSKLIAYLKKEGVDVNAVRGAGLQAKPANGALLGELTTLPEHLSGWSF